MLFDLSILIHDQEQALADLRHLYQQMLAGHIHNTKMAAEGLLGPAIKKLEQTTRKLNSVK